ncbi:MAG: HAMP domain-containing sensor histidine kinase [Nevskia sp.]|nr:HAMP domain-containing sensor histidine kinase [Nevskia sp.]
MPTLYVHVALTLALIESLGLGILLLRLKGVPGLGLLVTFLFGVGVWALSCELPVWFGPAAGAPAVTLVAFSSLVSAVFFHFVLVLCGVPGRGRYLATAYAAGGAATVVALLIPPGRYLPWHGFPAFFVPNAIGWVVGLIWMLLAVAGHAVMFWYWLRRRGPPRGQLVAMCMASGWGALCMSGYGFPAVGIDLYPLPLLLLLPLYPLFLVYGILRYQLMVVNAWARRALAWTLLVALGSAVVIGLAALPLPFNQPVSGWRLWAVAVATLLASGLLLDPFRRLATRLVYPGSSLADGALERWLAALAAADSYEALASIAARELSAQLRVQVVAVVDASGRAHGAALVPTLLCLRHAERWAPVLSGWDAAPPGPRYVAQMFGSAVAEAAGRLEQAMAFAGRERERQQQQRLAELGALAATVAHDIRNPLNIIAMAAATAPAELRQEIAVQTGRIAQLASDLLDYAKSWQIAKQPLDLADHVRAAAARYPELEIGHGLTAALTVEADPRRLSQALLNLFENARAALAQQGGARRVLVDARRDNGGAVELYVCDDGPGVPEEIRHTLFQPFVSRRPDGTGLGLAIVAKIMQAHGGSVRLEQRPGWSTCFVLTFPAESKP